MMRNFCTSAVVISCVVAMLAGCGPAVDSGPKLKSQKASGLPQAVYDVIATHNQASVVEKNTIMGAVKVAMDAVPKVQVTRDAAIDKAVNANGAYAGWALAIKAAVDAADPIGQTLKTQRDSGLPQAVYDVIAISTASVAERNAIMDAVKNAMDAMPKVQATRDAAIDAAVNANGAYAGLAAAIKAAVDAEDPIPPPPATVKTQAASGLTPSIYKEIANHGTASVDEKNAVIDAVKNAMDAMPQVQATRDAAIDAAVTANGDYAGWANAIKAKVDLVSPVIQPLMTQAASGLAQEIYDVITTEVGGNNNEYNAILIAVKNIVDTINVLNLRNTAINKAVQDNNALGHFNEANFAQAIRAIVDTKHPLLEPLKSLAESKLLQPVYDVIFNYAPATIKHKNGMLDDVRAAVTKTPPDKAIRDNDLNAAVNDNGSYVGLAALIINAVDAAYPIAAQVVLTQLAPSGLLQPVYDAIVNYTKPAGKPAVTNAQKNAIMVAVKAALDVVPQVQDVRDAAIKKAVTDNGNHDQLLDVYVSLSPIIQRAANKASPIVQNTAYVGVLLDNTKGSGLKDANGKPSSFIVQVTQSTDPTKANPGDRVYLHPDKYGESVLDYGDTIYFDKLTPKAIADDPAPPQGSPDKIKRIFDTVKGFN